MTLHVDLKHQEVSAAIAELERLIQRAEDAYQRLVEADEDEYDD